MRFTKVRFMLMWILASILTSISFFVYSYTKNYRYISGKYFTYFLLGIVFVSLLLWLVARVITRSNLYAYLHILFFWTYCITSKSIIDTFPEIRINVVAQYVILLIGFYILTVASCFLCKKIKNMDVLSVVPLTLFSVIICINLFPMLATGRFVKPGDYKSAVKTEFLVSDASLDRKPNVYWIHCDGMLGIQAYEKYFDYDISPMKEFFISRGFLINPCGNFEAAHMTQIAEPALMCPSAYDNYISYKMADHQSAMNYSKSAYINDVQLYFRAHNELLTAFKMNGYASFAMEHDFQYFVPNTDVYYSMGHGVKLLPKTASDEDLIAAISKLNLRKQWLQKVSPVLAKAYSIICGLPSQKKAELSFVGEIVQCDTKADVNDAYGLESNSIAYWSYLMDSYAYESPKILMINLMSAHAPFTRNEYGAVIRDATTNVLDYEEQYVFAFRALMTTVESIQANDPSAVIVVQGDHGLHANTNKQFTAAFGDENCWEELWNDTISMIFVPDQYKNEEEQYAIANPLNISRYLVNNFVGHNYEYLN